MKEILKNRIRELTSIIGVTGREEKIGRHMKEELGKYSDEIKTDNMGNIYAIKDGYKEGPTIMISAHMDQIGFTVRNILDNGFILFEIVGGISNKVIIGREVLINGEIPGVIGIKSSHLERPEEARIVKGFKESYIDVAASSRAEVEAMGIRIGDRIEFRSDFLEMHNKDYICSKSLDNRTNCAILIELFKSLDPEDFAGRLVGLASVQEELGMKGALIGGNNIDPDYAIAIDTIPSGDTPDISYERDLPVKLNAGPALVLGEGLPMGMMFTHAHPKVVEALENSAREVKVNLQPVTLLTESYATDGETLSMSGRGVPVGILSVPRRYSHSPIEMLNINDAVGSFKVLKKLIENNENIDLDFYS